MKKNQPEWKWIPYDKKILALEKGNHKEIDLEADIQFSDPDKGENHVDIKIEVTKEKQFEYSDEIGWYWVATKKIPGFFVDLKINVKESEEQLLPPQNLMVQVYAVESSDNYFEKNSIMLKEFGLQGNKESFFLLGSTLFEDLKFNMKDLKTQTLQAHLIISFYIDSYVDGKKRKKVLESVISPQFSLYNSRQTLTKMLGCSKRTKADLVKKHPKQQLADEEFMLPQKKIQINEFQEGNKNMDNSTTFYQPNGLQNKYHQTDSCTIQKIDQFENSSIQTVRNSELYQQQYQSKQQQQQCKQYQQPYKQQQQFCENYNSSFQQDFYQNTPQFQQFQPVEIPRNLEMRTSFIENLLNINSDSC